MFSQTITKPSEPLGFRIDFDALSGNENFLVISFENLRHEFFAKFFFYFLLLWNNLQNVFASALKNEKGGKG